MTARPSVLIVDDDAGMVDTLADVFTAKGFDTATAHSGQAAVSMIERAPYDVVLMDIQMPGLNGIQALKAIRMRLPGIPVIMMTAFTRHELVEEANRAAVAVLSKPLELDDVLQLIERTLRTAKKRRPT